MSANKSDEETEMVLVPRLPTREMIEAAYEAALAEDAATVWNRMIEEWISVQKDKL
jgi:hypothetical protein